MRPNFWALLQAVGSVQTGPPIHTELTCCVALLKRLNRQRPARQAHWRKARSAQNLICLPTLAARLHSRSVFDCQDLLGTAIPESENKGEAQKRIRLDRIGPKEIARQGGQHGRREGSLSHMGDCSFLPWGPLGMGNLPYWVARFQRFLLVLCGSGGKLPGMNHYHAKEAVLKVWDDYFETQYRT
jgi:hypothetical protein